MEQTGVVENGIRVVRVLGSLDVGGAEQRTLDLLPRLTEDGIQLHVVALSGRPGALAERAERLGALIHPVRLDARFPVRFVQLLRVLRPQVVHSDVATFSGAILLLAALGRVPVRIAHFRSDGDGRASTWGRRAQRRLMRRLIDIFATRVVGVSPGALSHGYRQRWETDPRCVVVPNGLDTRRLFGDSTHNLRELIGATADECICLHVGRPSEVKRRWFVPRVVAEMSHRGIAGRAVFVGPYDDRDDQRVLAAARASGVADRVHLLGPCEDVGGLMRQADVLLLPSSREGLPGVLLEAVAVGTPAVASDLPGVRFIADQVAGVTLVDGNDPEAWADAIHAARKRVPTPSDRKTALAVFEDGVFSVNQAVRRLTALYAGG